MQRRALLAHQSAGHVISLKNGVVVNRAADINRRFAVQLFAFADFPIALAVGKSFGFYFYLIKIGALRQQIAFEIVIVSGDSKFILVIAFFPFLEVFI